jgi:HEPN domain-containing protein
MIQKDAEASGKKWILQAIHDKKMAEAVMSVEAYDIAAFLVHQSVEKLLKGILIYQGKTLPKHHHLDQLAILLGILEEIREPLSDIIPDYQISRYPDVTGEIPYTQYNRAISEEKLLNANKIFDFISARYPGIL